MKIIGHRGAAGLALENTLSSIRTALHAGVDVIEIDIRLTKDLHFVLSHDPSLRRVGGNSARISSLTLQEIQQIRLNNGEKPPTLRQAYHEANGQALFIEAKGNSWASTLADEIKHIPYTNISVIAMNHAELAVFHALAPDVPTFAVQHFKESEFFSTLRAAIRNSFTGIDLNFWQLNPLTYWLAKKYRLQIVVYTVNHIWLARFVSWLFPDVSITTNHPEKLQFLRKPQSNR